MQVSFKSYFSPIRNQPLAQSYLSFLAGGARVSFSKTIENHGEANAMQNHTRHSRVIVLFALLSPLRNATKLLVQVYYETNICFSEKDEMRRLSEKVAVLQSRLMTDDNHPVDNITSRRRQSAFTTLVTETGSDLKAKRLSLQLPLSQLPNCERGKEKSSKNLMPDVNKIQEASFPLKLNRPSSSTSSLRSVSVHSKEVSQRNSSLWFSVTVGFVHKYLPECLAKPKVWTLIKNLTDFSLLERFLIVL